jgi:hypothetical protein
VSELVEKDSTISEVIKNRESGSGLYTKERMMVATGLKFALFIPSKKYPSISPNSSVE